MAKITKKEYTDRMNSLKNSLQIVTSILDDLKEKYLNNIGQYEIDYVEVPEYWNKMHDLQYDIEQSIHSLENGWNTRDWTYQDWAEYELVAMNID